MCVHATSSYPILLTRERIPGSCDAYVRCWRRRLGNTASKPLRRKLPLTAHETGGFAPPLNASPTLRCVASAQALHASQTQERGGEVVAPERGDHPLYRYGTAVSMPLPDYFDGKSDRANAGAVYPWSREAVLPPEAYLAEN